jgi:hypothetical protein
MTVRELETCCVIDVAGRAANLQSSLARGRPWARKQQAHGGKLAIVGSGPSARQRLETLRQWPGEIWAINGAYNYLCGEAIVPDGFVGVDPLPGLAEYVAHGQPQTKFYIAATCDPAVLDRLNGHSVCLWFPQDEESSYPRGCVDRRWRTGALTRAPFLAYLLGWRDITLFGADSSFEDGRYCYGDGSYAEDSKAEINAVSVGDEGPFLTEINLIKQITQLGVIEQQFQGMLKFDCDGLIAAYLRSPMHNIDKDGNVTRKDEA